MRFFSSIDMQGNAILNCPTITQFSELLLEDYNTLKDDGKLDENAVYLILDPGTDEVLEVFYGAKLISTEGVVVVEMTLVEYRELELNNQINDRVFYVISDDSTVERPVNQIEVTRKQYQELLRAGAIDPNMFYIITDDFGFAQLDTSINDGMISEHTTWSSEQIDRRIAAMELVWEPMPEI